MDKKAKIVVIAMGMLVVTLITFIIVDKAISKMADNQKSNNIVVSQKKDNVTANKKSNDIKKDEDDKKKVENTEKKEETQKTEVAKEETANKEQKQVKETKSEDKAVTAVKSALKNKNWLKKNIYIQDDENRLERKVVDQKINFLVCKKSDKPIILITVTSEEALFEKMILVSYNDGNVTCEKLSEGHIYHGEYSADANKYMVCSDFCHMGNMTTTYVNVSTGKAEFVGEYGTYAGYDADTGDDVAKYYINNKSYGAEFTQVSQEEYENYKNNLNKDTYNFVPITTELNDTNVDKYIK